MESEALIWTVEPADDSKGLKSMFSRLQLSHSLVVKLKQQHKITVNGIQVYTNYQVRCGDLIAIDIHLEEQNDIMPEDVPLQIVYEDKDLLVIDKPRNACPSRQAPSVGNAGQCDSLLLAAIRMECPVQTDQPSG